MSDYSHFFVSNKLALYSHDLQKVMVMEYPPRGIWGLPGGHLDPGEEPEAAMARELKEELGIVVDNFKKADFFIRNFGEDGEETVILAYTAIAPEGFQTFPTDFAKEHDIWVTRDEIHTMELAASYKKFIVANWPSK
jgi:8-oxo-dGTP pyrophosphatase MutT (NUDIX family)